MKWYAIQIKPVYDRPSQYRALKEILTTKYGILEENIWICGDAKRENLYQGYVFLQYGGDFAKTWEDLQKERLIEKESGYLEIPSNQMDVMLKEAYPEKEREEFNILDVVILDESPWNQLYGIVVDDKSSDVYEIGVKLHLKTHFLLLRENQIHRCKSLFEVWKFKR